MFLFIFESIGTSELMLIGLVALIVFGPRKLPQMAKTIGKSMAEFRRAGQEFKTTWEREANLDGDAKDFFNLAALENDASRKTARAEVIAPEIKAVENPVFPPSTVEHNQSATPPTPATDKQDWL